MIKKSLPETQLKTYDNSWYDPGKGSLTRIVWYMVNVLFLINPLNPISSLKVGILRLFGAKIGKSVNIKPGVNIKYPWNLSIGDYAWIGEKVWIDNLAPVRIGPNACISQGAMLLTGNHNYKKVSFDLMLGEIDIAAGAWIGAQSVVCPGITCHSHSILSVGSVATADLEAYSIYQGVPAQKVRERNVADQDD